MDDRDPQFEDFETTISADGVDIPLRITADALHAIWGAGVGPQTAQSIFDENRAVFEEIVADKIKSAQGPDGAVIISDLDLDM